MPNNANYLLQNVLTKTVLIISTIVLLGSLISCESKIHSNKQKNKNYTISYVTSNQETFNPILFQNKKSNWIVANDFSFLRTIKDANQIFIKIKFTKKNVHKYYFYTNDSINRVNIQANSRLYWETPANSIFFSSHIVPIILDTDEIFIHIEKNKFWFMSGSHVHLQNRESLQISLFHKHLFRSILGSIFVMLGFILWGLIIIRPHETISILSFESFLLLIGTFCLSSSSIVHYLYPTFEHWPLISMSSMLLAPVSLVIYCTSISKEISRFWKAVLHSTSALILLCLVFVITSFLYFQSNEAINLLSPILLLICLCMILFLGINLSLQSKISNKIHGWGLIFFCMFFAFDIINSAFDLNLVSDFLSPYGALLLIISVFVILEVRFSRAITGLEKSLDSLRNINKSYNRFIPKEFFEFLNKKEITDVKLGDNIQNEFTILVTDIHRFTALSEKMTPVENFDFVNSYFRRIVPCINGNNGFIAKYMGDGIMALFPGSSSDAVKCAMDIQNILYVYNQSRAARNREAIDTGIGIHRGTARLGIIGSEARMQGDIISDTANMAARTEGLTRIYGAMTIISESAYNDLKDNHTYQFRTLDRVRMKGKENATTIFELLTENIDGSLNLKLKTLNMFNRATHAYLNRNFAGCAEIMQDIQEINENDLAVKRYIDSAMFFAINGVPDDWDGITELDRKS